MHVYVTGIFVKLCSDRRMLIPIHIYFHILPTEFGQDRRGVESVPADKLPASPHSLNQCFQMCQKPSLGVVGLSDCTHADT